MKRVKKFLSTLVAIMMVATMMTTNVNGLDVNASFVQNNDTLNGYGYFDKEVDQFETYSKVEGTAGSYTSLASKIYKPVSGDTLIVVFHGNGEGGVEGNCNNYAQLAANRLAVTYISDDIQSAFKGAYVLAFQAPDYWYNDYTSQAKAIIDKAVSEFGIKQIFISGLSAGGLMSERMLATYGDFFDGALFSCAAIAKNNQYVEGLGGDYENATEFLDEGDQHTDGKKFMKPSDFDTYIENYRSWLDDIAKSNVPIFMVHCYYDTTIYYRWSQLAYEHIKSYREKNNLDGDIYCGLIDDVNYGSEGFSQHWSWIKMLNGDVYASADPNLDTISWFKSLSASTNAYQPKTYTNPTAGASDQENTYNFNLIGQVYDDGQKVNAIEIDLNDAKVDASKLTPEMFKVTGYNEDASGLIENGAGNFGSKENPEKMEISSVSVNEAGNIVLTFSKPITTLNWNGDTSRNLATSFVVSIEPITLPMIDETDNKPVTPVEDNKNQMTDTKVTSVKTGDDCNLYLYSGLMVLTVLSLTVLKKRYN